jgi:hypothetical protein
MNEQSKSRKKYLIIYLEKFNFLQHILKLFFFLTCNWLWDANNWPEWDKRWIYSKLKKKCKNKFLTNAFLSPRDFDVWLRTQREYFFVGCCKAAVPKFPPPHTHHTLFSHPLLFHFLVFKHFNKSYFSLIANLIEQRLGKSKANDEAKLWQVQQFWDFDEKLRLIKSNKK